MILQELVYKEIVENHIRSAGHSGLKPVDIAIKLNVDYAEVRPCLQKLYDDGKITTREGINTRLIYQS